MKKLISIIALGVLMAFTAAAEDQKPKAKTAAAHSKAPAKARPASAQSHGKKKSSSKQNSKQAKQNQKHGKFAWLKFPGHHKKQS